MTRYPGAAPPAGAHFGQYHGAGPSTGRGLRFRHRAHRYRFPRSAVFGRTRFPLRSFFSPIAAPHQTRARKRPGWG